MKYNLEEIKILLNDFVHQKISKTELGTWAKLVYDDLLKGGYLEIDKLKCYPFVKVISTVHVEEDDVKGVYPCEMDEILAIRAILNGNMSKTYSIKVGLPWKLTTVNKRLYESKKQVYENIGRILISYSDGENIDDKDVIALRHVLTLKEEKENTIQYFVDSRIKSYIKDNINWDDNSMDIKQGLWLYAIGRPNPKELQKEVLKYLEFYTGRGNIGVEIFYDKGKEKVFFNI